MFVEKQAFGEGREGGTKAPPTRPSSMLFMGIHLSEEERMEIVKKYARYAF